MAKGWKTYWIAMVVVALCLFGWALLTGWYETIPQRSSGDYGPDPGSTESLRGIGRARQNAPFYAALTAFYWLAFSGLVAGLYIAVRGVLQSIRIR